MRQLVLSQQVNLVQQNVKTCGICNLGDHYPESCPQLQETSQSPREIVAGIFQGQNNINKPIE